MAENMYQHILDKAKPPREPSTETEAADDAATPARTRAHPAGRTCSWPGCDAVGDHRAPKSRDELEQYHWFCLEHVRVYNKAWNYYAGLSEEEVEQEVRRDTTWRRPSWPLGAKKIIGAIDGIESWVRDFGLDGDAAARRARGDAAPDADRPAKVRDAYAVLGLPATADAAEAKRCYKELVKRHHPDVNDGDKMAEEKFKQINEAYRAVREYLAF